MRQHERKRNVSVVSANMGYMLQCRQSACAEGHAPITKKWLALHLAMAGSGVYHFAAGAFHEVVKSCSTQFCDLKACSAAVLVLRQISQQCVCFIPALHGASQAQSSQQ